MAGFAMVCNHALRDNMLSLAAKGLYMVISSFAGMPGWSLTKRALAQYSESQYALEKAWHELQQAGLLKHRCFRQNQTGAFTHVYDLLERPDETPAYQYISPSDRPGGDCRLVLAGDAARDFTKIPHDILRSTALPLAVKGLFGVIAHLAHIPNFHLHPAGVRAFCAERIKRFASVWRQLKLSGLFKQHRYPTGETGGFAYGYDLLDTPDRQTPYLTNHKADGTVSSVKTIVDFLGRASKKLQSIYASVRAAQPRRTSCNTVTYHSSDCVKKTADAPSEREYASLRQRIGYDTLMQQYDPVLVDHTVTALATLDAAPELTISKRAVPLTERRQLTDRVTREDIARFLSSVRIDLSRVKHPAAYLRAVLLAYLQKQDAAAPPPPCVPQEHALSDWDKAQLERIRSVRKRRLAAEAAEKNKSAT